MKSFSNPKRFHKNVPGPFYTTGDSDHGDCLFCGLPEGEAPELLAPLNDNNFDTYFVLQPRTPKECEAACSALRVCCVDALRYGGTDPEIIKRLGNDPRYCDYVFDSSGQLVQTIDEHGTFTDYALQLLMKRESNADVKREPDQNL